VNIEASRKELQALAQNGKGPFQTHLDGRWLPQLDLLRSEKLTAATIGYAGRLDSWTFALPREFPLNKYILLRPEEIEPALQAGKVSAVISELYPVPIPDSIPLPGTIAPPKQMIHVRDPSEFLTRNLLYYGVTLGQDKNSITLGAEAVESFSNINQLWPTKLESDPRTAFDPAYADSLLILLPISILSPRSTDIRVDIPLVRSFPSDQVSRVTCNAKDVAFAAGKESLVFWLSRDVLENDKALQSCRIHFKSSISVILDGDSNFPDVGYFGLPWTVIAEGG
jgi:hypothetical protein